MYDLTTSAGVLRFCESRRAEMARCFERVGRFEENGQSYCAYLFVTHDLDARGSDPRQWKTGAKLPAAKAFTCRMPNDPVAQMLCELQPERAKDVFAHVLRLQGRLQKAVGHVLMSEIWWTEMKGRSTEDVRAERAKMPDSLEFAPGRREGLMLTLEHQATGRRMWFAEILREPTRLLEWQEKTPDDAEGRLVNLTDWRS